MFIINGNVLTEEQVLSALHTANMLPCDIDRHPDINLVQKIPEGYLCAYIGGDVGYEGIYVDLVDPQIIKPGTKYISGPGLITVESPDPAVHPGECGLTAYIYGDLSKDEYTEQIEYRNAEAAFSD